MRAGTGSRDRRRQRRPARTDGPTDRRQARPSRPLDGGTVGRGPVAEGSGADEWLPRRWSGRRARLWAARAAYLDAASGPVLVGEAPAGAGVWIEAVWRVGPLIVDLRVLAHPEAAPELWLVAPWRGLDTQGR